MRPTAKSDDPVMRLLAVIANDEMSASKIREAQQIKHKQTFRDNYSFLFEIAQSI